MSDRQRRLGLAFATDVVHASEPSYLLRYLEVFNWGPFRGLHRAEFDGDGTAVIGPTGSGKTTLVDALMTQLVLQPRYNLASTGGHESDRTLMSYVRGVLGGDGSDGREEVARPGKTITGICATYQCGEDSLKLGGLLWTDGSSNSMQDLKRRWLFCQAEDQSLDQWLRLLHEDGVRDLMRMGRDTARLRIFESKKAYLVHTRKFFDVGENAFTLLNRAAGLKQLNSIDEIFRDLERLRMLNKEALPEKLRRFLDYLNRSSDQGVTQLLSGITEEVDAIEQRITELNQTLVKVDFRSGRYLQLQPQRIKHERLRSLENALRKLRSAALKDDQGETHYKALSELVEILRDAGQNRRQLGSCALLDPRYRLQFFVVEVDRQSGDRSPPRSGSQSGSGGEKELMASHVLTASLSYALCPLYGTVVLDEAFSKSSPSAASRIIEALRIFRLHPVFVTPNKEIGLLKQHTRKVICVQRPGKEASLASISWETLEELANP